MTQLKTRSKPSSQMDSDSTPSGDENPKDQLPVEIPDKSSTKSEATSDVKTDQSDEETLPELIGDDENDSYQYGLSLISQLTLPNAACPPVSKEQGTGGLSLISQLTLPNAACPPVSKEQEIERLSQDKAHEKEMATLRPSYDAWTYRFYCISLKTSTDRRERIRKRFAYHGLLKWLTFVDAVPVDSPLIMFYTAGMVPPIGTSKKQMLAAASCFASHLKALRIYLEDNNALFSRGTVICEDDVLLRNNWDQLYTSVMNNMPTDANLIQFSYMLDTWGNTIWVGKDPGKQNIFKLRLPEKGTDLATGYSTAAWGTQMYWISVPQAIQSITQFDRPFVGLQHLSLNTSELITILARGYLVYPVLAIEDCIGSLIRDDEGIKYHLKVFGPWGYSNYNGGDDNGINNPLSPLFEVERQITGRRPPPPPTKEKNVESVGVQLKMESKLDSQTKSKSTRNEENLIA